MFDFHGQIPPIYPDQVERHQALQQARGRLLRAMPAEPGLVLRDDDRIRELADVLQAVCEALDRLGALPAVWVALTREEVPARPSLRDRWWDFRIAALLGSPRRREPAALRRLFGDTNPFADERGWLLVRWRIVELIEAVLEATRPPEPARGDDLARGHVSQEEAAVLKAMLQHHPARATVGQLTALLRFDEKTIRSHQKALEEGRLVTGVETNGGRGLTPVGLSMAKALPEIAGQAFLRKQS
jgi:hypothetical protein